jgi:ABC-type lipoprotein release transport system permease subunit
MSSTKQPTGIKAMPPKHEAADVPQFFRLNVEVGDLDAATSFYTKLLGVHGRKQPGHRCYFDCGPVTLPFAPRATDGVLVAVVAIGISLIATVYPSWSAARILPAEALRYE